MKKFNLSDIISQDDIDKLIAFAKKYQNTSAIDSQEVLNQLKKAGYRITEQRKLLLHIILNNEYSSCKEIYYAAKKQDDKVGIATVYRTVQLLEDMELIHKEMVVRI